jgi:outer membrane protein assembly factor BamB
VTLLKDDPTWVGSYHLESRLGSGGMGVVYRACSASGQVVALKVIRRQWAEDSEFRARFELEVAAARMVHSKHTVPIIDADPHAPDPWMASPYIPGESLATRIREHGTLGMPQLRTLAQALASGLRDIHRAGVVHRDLKPGNVLLSEHGPQIIDFGVSRAVDGRPLTAAGQILGTPAFMAPEQFTSPSEAGPAADVFSLGCVLSFAATGRSPFEAGSPYAAVHQSMHEEPDLSALPDSLRDLVAVCLRKPPAERPTPEELLLALASCVPQRKTIRDAAIRTLRATATRHLKRRVPAWLMALTVLASAAMGIGTVAAWPTAPTATATIRHAQTDWHPWETSLKGHGNARRCSAYDEVIYCTTGNGSVARINTHDNGRIAWTHSAPADRHSNFTPPEGNTGVLGIAHGMVFIVRDRAHIDPDGSVQHLPSRLYVLNAGTGRTLWTRLLPRGVDVPGFREAQLVRENKTLYITDPAQDQVEAIDVTTRQTRWKRPLEPREVFTATSDALYAIRTTLRGSEHPDRTVITAVEPTTGSTAWTSTQRGRLDFVASVSGALYMAERNKDRTDDFKHTAVVRLDTRARTAVRVGIPGGFDVLWSFSTTLPVTELYGVADHDAFYLVKADGETIALDTKSQRVRWRHRAVKTDLIGLPTLVGAQIVYLTRYGEVFAMDTRTGEELWRTHPRTTSLERPWVSLSPVMVINGKLYAVSARNSVFAVDAAPAPPAPDQQK